MLNVKDVQQGHIAESSEESKAANFCFWNHHQRSVLVHGHQFAELHLFLALRFVDMRHHSSIDEVLVATKLNLFFDKRDLFVFIEAPKHGSVCKRYLYDVVPYFPFIGNKYIVLRGYSYFYSLGDDRFTECPKVKNIEMHITALILAHKLLDQVTSSPLIS